MITHDKRMSRAELEALKVGDKVYIFYAKDDNPENVRSDFEHEVVKTGTIIGRGRMINTSGGDTVWDWDLARYDNLVRGIDTSRGYAYFCKAAADMVLLPTPADIETIKAALTAVEGVTNARISVTLHVQTSVPHFAAQRRVHEAEAKIIKTHPHLQFDFSTFVQVKS